MTISSKASLDIGGGESDWICTKMGQTTWTVIELSGVIISLHNKQNLSVKISSRKLNDSATWISGRKTIEQMNKWTNEQMKAQSVWLYLLHASCSNWQQYGETLKVHETAWKSMQSFQCGFCIYYLNISFGQSKWSCWSGFSGWSGWSGWSG